MCGVDGQLCLVMDFIGGGDLYGHMAASRRLPEDRARFYASEIVLALEYLHDMDIIYRDLKPENVLLCEPLGQTPPPRFAPVKHFSPNAPPVHLPPLPLPPPGVPAGINVA